MSDIYEITYGPDEITIHRTSCKQPGLCTCTGPDDGVKCGYSLAEAKQKIINYYRNRVEYLEKLSLEDFEHDCGFYR